MPTTHTTHTTRRVYLDWNATAPPAKEVLDAMADAAKEAWGNPSSVHAAGRAARARIEDARGAVAALFDADPRDVVLTSGGTEANNLALRSAFSPARARALLVDGHGAPPVLVTSRLEHPSVTRVAEALEREGAARVRWLRVTADGSIDGEDLSRALEEGDARLIAIQAVNHETGRIQDVAGALERARAKGARLHVDAVQAVGKVPLDACFAADTVSLAAHKLRGPKGIGALVTRPGVRLEPILLGGSQERGLRPGTLDPLAAAGLAVAARRAKAMASVYAARVAPLRDALERALLARYPGAASNGGVAPGERAPHVANVFFPGWRGPELVAALDLEGISVSSGSACSAGTSDVSPILRAMHDEARAGASVRFSLGDETTEDDIAAALAAFGVVIARRASR